MKLTRSMEIKITKENGIKDYTFVNDGLQLDDLQKLGTITHRGQAPRDIRLRDTSRIKKLKKSLHNGGVQSTQGHSIAYE